MDTAEALTETQPRLGSDILQQLPKNRFQANTGDDA